MNKQFYLSRKSNTDKEIKQKSCITKVLINLSAVIAQCRDKWGSVVSADKTLLEQLKVEYHILMDEYNKEKPEGTE